MKQDLNRAGRPKPLRRTAARSFSLATKQQRFQDVEGRCEACGELIGDETDWRQAIYHHSRLVSDPVSDKEARSAANYMVLHPRITTTRSIFTTCMDFSRTISEGSRKAGSGKSRRKRQRALRAREDAERPLLHVLAAVDRDIGAGHERRLVRA